MTDRITNKDLDAAFDRWLAIVGGRRAESYNDVGGYLLDNNPTYGGVQINQITSIGGGIRNIDSRLTPRAFWWAVHFAQATVNEIHTHKAKP